MSSTRPRIIFLTQFYDPEPAYKGQAFAEAVRDLGYDVEVVTGFPNYPGGKIYDGYRIRPIKRSEQNGIAITRLALYPSHDTGKFGRIFNYLSFSLSAFLYLVFLAKRPALVHVYNPPLTVGLAATAARIFRRFPVVVDIHDLWPDTLPATGMISDPRALSILDRAANWMYRHVQHIVLHTEGFRATLLDRHVPAEKMTTVLGWAKEDQDGAMPMRPVPDAMRHFRGMKILYAGNIGPAQSLGAVLQAAHMLEEQGMGDKITFCFLGSGVSLDALKTKAAELALSNVAFLPRVPSNEVKAFLDAADCLLVHLRDTPLFEMTLPSKIQAYMYAGKPLLMGVRGEAARLIKCSASGITVTPEDPESIAAGAIALAEMSRSEREALGQNGRKYYERELSMHNGMLKFAEVFNLVRHN
jgi:glycosyltransferase involved in cell wall biosynthesis